MLSTWKVYIGYIFFAYNAKHFAIASAVILSAVALSNLACYFLYAQIRELSRFKRFQASSSYQKGLRFYNKYGFYPSVLLAPILLGIPTISLISLAFGASNKKVLLALMTSSVFWGAGIFVLYRYSIGTWF